MRLRVFFTCLLLWSAAFSLACPKRVSIADIVSRPEKYQSKEVVVAGTVKESYGLSLPGTRLGGGLYKIDDGTGSLWVIVSEGSVPAKGTAVGVQGRVATGISWNGRNYGLGMREERRRSR